MFRRTLETIDPSALAALPVATIAPTYHIDRSEGSGCFMDPPGFPSYFIRHVYDRNGNDPSKGPEAVIMDDSGTFRVLWRAEHYNEKARKATLASLYRPLPIDHPRVKAWIRTCFGYFRNGWVKAEGSRNVADLLFSHLPIPETMAATGYGLERYRPVDYIRQWYPEADPVALVMEYADGDGYGKGGPGDWWERHSRKPTPEQCPGDTIGGHRGHPTSGTWCQFCGWVAPSE